MVRNMYWRWVGVLPKDFCEYVLKSIDWNKASDAVVGANEAKLNKELRNSKVVWAEQFSVIGCVAQTYIMAANRSAGWNYDLSYYEQIQQTKYADNGYYGWHVDTAEPNAANQQRKLTVSILLNDPKDYEGGKFQFKNLSEEDNLLAKQGSIIVFPSFLEHQVTPVTSGARYTAVTWAMGNAFV